MSTNSRELYKMSKSVSSVEDYLDNNYESLITSEMRAYMAKFSDPLNLNFKLMVDFDKPSGLFADEYKYTDSALAYLKRIGENERYNMLLKWISVFKTFIRSFDFLILEVEGIDEIINHKAGDMYNDDAKISLIIRETSDMLCQSLLTTYRHIWFDDIRCVEVLPSNLRKFDLNILIFNSGYYNLAIYYFVDNADKYDFNHHLIMLKSVSIDNEESGKSFFSTLSNEMSGDGVKNNMVLHFRFATYKGNFNNIFGEFDFVSLLAIAAVENKRMSILSESELRKEMSLAGNNTEPYMTKTEQTRAKFSEYFKNTGEAFKSTGTDIVNVLKKKPADYSNKYFGPTSTISSAIETMTDPTMLAKMARNTFDLGITYAEDKFANAFVSKINNLVLNNFSENFVDVYKKYFEPKQTNIQLIKETKPTEVDTQITQQEQTKGISLLQKSNIYTRTNF
jgi:hypothetical protein